MRAVERGGAGGRAANRDLDAVCVLFDYAQRTAESSGDRGVRNFVAELQAQRIVGDTLAARAARDGAVHLTSAHQAKGREWDLVVVADAQDGLWPDLRPRGSLLGSDQLASAGHAPAGATSTATSREAAATSAGAPTAATSAGAPSAAAAREAAPSATSTGAPREAAAPAAAPSAAPATPAAGGRAAMLAEERRLFYLAITRARHRLVVTAVDSALAGGDAAEAPSRFVRELGVEARPAYGPRRRPLTIAALVAGLRERLVDPKSSETLRAAAAWRLARLAEARDADGAPLVRAAHPGGWWGIRELTDAATPVRDPGAPLRLSASQVATLKECALRWFLGHEASADEPASTAQGFGNVVHALADDVARGDAPADLDVLMERLDRVWHRLAYDAPWQSAQERDEARAALERFLTWHVAERGRVVATSEHGFDVTLKAGDYRIRVAGKIDRVETGEAGQVYLVDFKTGRTPETERGAAEHPQLAVYQLAAGAGALEDTSAAQGSPGGAELVYLRSGKGGMPAVRDQLPFAEAPQGPDWAERLIADVAARVLDERFGAYGEHDCDRCQFRSCCPKQPEGRPLVE